MKRACGVLAVVLGLVSWTARAQTTEQEAGDTSEVNRDAQGPLRERIAPVSGQIFLRRGRFEISPSATLSIKDSFFTKYIFGGTLTYHLTETLGVGLRAGYSVPVVSGAAQICTTESTGTGFSRGCRLPRYDEVNGRAPGQITLLGGLDLQWAPIYGKISLLAERFVHFDLYAVGGVAAVQHIGPNPKGGDSLVPQLTVGGNVGVGMHFFINRWMTARAELRDLIYVEQPKLVPNPLTQNQFLFELGISLFFPTTSGES